MALVSAFCPAGELDTLNESQTRRNNLLHGECSPDGVVVSNGESVNARFLDVPQQGLRRVRAV